MLSYLRDANQTPAAAQMPSAADGAAEQAPSAQKEYLRTAAHGRNARQGTIILVILFTVGAAGVWWMVKKSGLAQAQGSSGAETSQIDQALAQLTSFQSQMNSQMDTVSGRFYQASELGQITVSELKKNPFRQEWALEQPTEDLTASQSQMRKEEMQRRAAQLKLWSITERDTNSCCMINDKVLYVGDTIHGFTVKEITPQSVLLAFEDITVELKMQ